MKVVRRYPYVHVDTDRHGNTRVYVRRAPGQRKLRLRSDPGTPAFDSEYEAALAQLREERRKPRLVGQIVEGSLGWLCSEYKRSSNFTTILSPRSQYARTRILDWICHQPFQPGSTSKFGDCPLKSFSSRHVNVLMERKARAKALEAANTIRKSLRVVFAWGLEAGLIDNDPTVGVRRKVVQGDGFRVWTPEDLLKFERRHALGTKARAAYAIASYTGLRRQDIVKLGPQHIEGSVLRFKTQKKGVPVSIQVHPELQRALDTLPRNDLVFLTTAYGRPFTPAGFGNWFRDRCDEAGLKMLSLHGLRKAFATRLAQHGLTTHELMAVCGWMELKEAHRYTQSAERERLSLSGMLKLGNRD